MDRKSRARLAQRGMAAMEKLDLPEVLPGGCRMERADRGVGPYKAPARRLCYLPVGADDSVRPQNMSILRESSAGGRTG